MGEEKGEKRRGGERMDHGGDEERGWRSIARKGWNGRWVRVEGKIGGEGDLEDEIIFFYQNLLKTILNYVVATIDTIQVMRVSWREY